MSTKAIKKRVRSTRDEQEQEQFDRKQRKPRDAAAPKRPPTSYVLFCKRHREEAMQEARAIEPKPTVRTISTVLSTKWKVVDPSEKEEYERQSMEFRERYYADKKAYDKVKAEQQQKQQIDDASAEKRAPEGAEGQAAAKAKAGRRATKDQAPADEGSSKAKRVKKVKKDESQPKRPIPAYIYFCNQNRGRARESMDESSNAKLVLTKLGAMWQELTSEEKIPYEVLAKADRQRYDEAIIVWSSQKHTVE